MTQSNLNTSYVEVKLTHLLFTYYLTNNLNTSYVEVKHLKFSD